MAAPAEWEEDINLFVPSLLEPRTARRPDAASRLTQCSSSSRLSLSLRKPRTVLQEIAGFGTQLTSTSNQYCKSAHTKWKNNDQKIYQDVILSKSVVAKNKNKENFGHQNNLPLACKVSVNFGIINCDKFNITTTNASMDKIEYTRENNNVTVDCELNAKSCISLSSTSEVSESLHENMIHKNVGTKRPSVAVNLEIKKRKTQRQTVNNTNDNSKILVLNTSAIENLSHIIVQPPNYKIIKHQCFDNNNSKTGSGSQGTSKQNVRIIPFGRGRQRSITDFFKDCKSNVDRTAVEDEDDCILVSSNDTPTEMSRKSHGDREPDLRKVLKGSKKDGEASPRKYCVNRASSCDATPQPMSSKVQEYGSSNRKNVESLSISLSKSQPNKSATTPRPIPPHKVVAGTHFAVDAFSYGDIPNVKTYFLTHFHSDHYAGLKRTFNKILYCSKITADLCTSRLGINPKSINIIHLDETQTIDGVQVTAVDANHCPGAIMLVFGLACGKNILHCGDFRASHVMESYPVFWNRDIHTVYLDTTYCNPRYDFPTQDESLEMAVWFLQQKKMALEKMGKKFSSVLIVCGTYTIGKEKFFLGMARRVGSSVWACPEKDRVLQVVEGRSFSQSAPHVCQIHVVPMRELTHSKLKTYLESLQGAFSEVVAFKPSGWENGKNSSVARDEVTIHGIPYSEHSSFSEMVRFVKFLKPRLMIPTVDIAGGIKAAQKYFPCPLAYTEDASQTKLTDYYGAPNRTHIPAVT